MPAQNVLMEQTNAHFPYDFIIQRVTFHIGSISPSLIHKVSCHFQAFIISVWLINAACLHMAAEYVLSVVICLLFQFEWMVSQAFLRADFTLPSLICHTEATTVEKLSWRSELSSLRAWVFLFWIKKCERGWRRTITWTMGNGGEKNTSCYLDYGSLEIVWWAAFTMQSCE